MSAKGAADTHDPGAMLSKKTPDDAYDPGAALCGHRPRAERFHYLGGGLWVCFECFAKLLIGIRGKRP